LADRSPKIGQLRWPVVIATRQQAADPASPGILETLAKLMTVHADIQPIGAMTFFAGVQVDTPVTHRITLRWLDWVDTTCVIFRTTTRLDLTTRVERFRVRRLAEIAGRKRFIQLDCELELQQ
jgi:head-tail adaptor